MRDFRRFAPRLVVEPATGGRYQRIERYAGGWDVLLIGYQMMVRDLTRSSADWIRPRGLR